MSIRNFTAGLAVLTLFLSGTPALAAAASNSLIKSTSSPSVYYLGGDGKRYVFPDEKTYKTWFVRFSDITTVSDSELASYQIGGNVTYRPGIRMVKISSDPKTYVVDKGGMLRWVKSEAAAKRLYGSDWNKKIDTIPVYLFMGYKMGGDVDDELDFNPTAKAAEVVSIAADKLLSGATSARAADTSPVIGDALAIRQAAPLQSGSVSGGGNTVTVAQTSDATSYLTVPGADSVPVLGFSLTPTADMKVKYIHLTMLVDANRDGVFARGSENGTAFSAILENCRIYEAGIRISAEPMMSFSASYKTLSSVSMDEISIPAGQTRKLSVRCDVSPTAPSGAIAALMMQKVNDEYALPLLGSFVTPAGEENIVTDSYRGLPINGTDVVAPVPSVYIQSIASASAACTADTWSCASWGSCSATGSQTRTCTMTNDCVGVTTASPATTQSCTPAAACTADTWSCGSWSACGTNGSQTRTCTMTNDCAGISTAAPLNSQSCNYAPPASLELSAGTGASSMTVNYGDTAKPVFAFGILPRGGSPRLISGSFVALVDSNSDGVFARGSENGKGFGAYASNCGVYDGDVKHGATLIVNESTGLMSWLGLLDETYVIPGNTVKNLVVKCDIAVSAPAGKFAIAMADMPSNYEIIADFPNVGMVPMVTGTTVSGLPLNGNGTSTANVQITVQPFVFRGPTVAPIALPSSILTDGSAVIARLMVLAPNGAVALRRLTFDSTLGGQLHGMTLETGTGSSVREIGTMTNFPGSVNSSAFLGSGSDHVGSYTFRVDFQDPILIPAGGSKNLEFRTTVVGSASGDSVSTVVEGSPAYPVGPSGPTAWSAATADGNGGYVISSTVESGANGTPTVAQVLSR